MTIAMKPVQVFGRASLSFPVVDGDWDKTLQREMQFTSRPSILKNWNLFPDFVHKDQGFMCLLDHYHPMTEEDYKLRVRIRGEQIESALRDVVGTDAGKRYMQAVMSGQKPTDQDILEVLQAMPQHRACVDYCAPFGGSANATSTTSTARTVVGAKPRANQSNYMWGFSVGFDGTTSTNGPAIIELMQNTWATNAPGTNSTSLTVYPLDNGRPETIQTSCGCLWTSTHEPTVLTLWDNFLVPSYMGSGIVFQPLTKPFILTSAIGGSMRITQQTAVTANGTGSLKLQE